MRVDWRHRFEHAQADIREAAEQIKNGDPDNLANWYAQRAVVAFDKAKRDEKLWKKENQR